MKSLALYARVSTKNKSQDPETQLLPLRAYAEQRQARFEIYCDVGVSGSRDSRPELDRMMEDARRRRFDGVVVARFDRFARSTRHLILALEEFGKLGIQFVSLAEAIDTSTSMGKMVFTIIGAVAELERNLIRERVIAGIERARTQGKQLGRRIKIVDKEKVIRIYNETKSLRLTANECGIGKDKVREIVKQSQGGEHDNEGVGD